MGNLANLFRSLILVGLTTMIVSGSAPVSAGFAPATVVPATAPDSKILFETIRSGSSAALQALLDKGADANDTLDGYSALMAAALSGSVDQMRLLIAHGAKVNAMNADGLTALWYSVPDWDKTTLLLDHGADPRLPSKEGYTVLAKVVHSPGTLALFHLLIDKGADPRKCGPDNMLLYNAASNCDTAILGLLIRSGLSTNDTISSGDYPINAALTYRCFASVKMLVENGADVNVRPMNFGLDPTNGITPLMLAAGDDDKASFFYLLDHGANPSIKSKYGYTALMYLQQCEKDEPEMTTALIQHGASPSDKMPGGEDALYFAQKKGNCQSAQILKKYLTK
jgi:ankyrin repeat protein